MNQQIHPVVDCSIFRSKAIGISQRPGGTTAAQALLAKGGHDANLEGRYGRFWGKMTATINGGIPSYHPLIVGFFMT